MKTFLSISTKFLAIRAGYSGVLFLKPSCVFHYFLTLSVEENSGRDTLPTFWILQVYYWEQFWLGYMCTLTTFDLFLFENYLCFYLLGPVLVLFGDLNIWSECLTIVELIYMRKV